MLDRVVRVDSPSCCLGVDGLAVLAVGVDDRAEAHGDGGVAEAFADKMRPHRPFLYSNAKMRFQSFFMLITVQPRAFASVIND
jgi:hypothetical protein